MTDAEWHDFFTLESYIANQQKLYPHSRGKFSDILRRLGLASKIVASRVRKAGLVQVLGKQGSKNIQGEEQMKLDVLSNDVIKSCLQWMPAIAALGSEEDSDLMILGHHAENVEDQYIVYFDPMDGSSNVDVNITLGMIFSIHRYPFEKRNIRPEDFTEPGSKQVAAGYVVYGPSTMFVYTTGQGVHGFTLDPEFGEYVLSHENLKIPNKCTYFSANDSHYPVWPEGARQFADRVRYSDEPRYIHTSSRYAGTLVADFHRNLLAGGVYIYPENAGTGKKKLRLVYECAPLAMIAEQAGGMATSGYERILDMDPADLHQRSSLAIGNRTEVKLYYDLLNENKPH